jgi:hypothetical protein
MADDIHSTILTPIDVAEKKFSYVSTRTNAVDPTRDGEVTGEVQKNAGFGKAELMAHIAGQFDALDTQRADDTAAQAAIDAIVTEWQTDIDDYLDTRGD